VGLPSYAKASDGTALSGVYNNKTLCEWVVARYVKRLIPLD